MSVRWLPHTADVRAEIEAPTVTELYQDATDLVRDLVVGDAPVDPKDRIDIEALGADEAEAFHRFVRELLFAYDVDGLIPLRVDLGAGAGAVAEAAPDAPFLGRTVSVVGERFDARRHETHHHVKALTWHHYRFERTTDGFVVELVFDV